MKIEILNEKENSLLRRKEVEVRITHDAATPSISEIRKKIAASKDIGKGTIIIESFKSKYGSRETLGTVKVYQTKERALEIEPRHRLIKNGLIETEEKPAEPKPEEVKEKPKEEPAEKAEEEPKLEKEKEEKKPERVKEKEAEKPKKANEEPKPKEVKKEKPKEIKEKPAEEPKKESKKANEEPKPEEDKKEK